jgi:hypothetical protein
MTDTRPSPGEPESLEVRLWVEEDLHPGGPRARLFEDLLFRDHPGKDIGGWAKIAGRVRFVASVFYRGGR